MPLYSVTDGNERHKSTKAHIFKIIYAPVFIDLKYIHGFQNRASIMKEKMERNFWESQIRGISYSQMQQVCTCQICWYCAGAQSPTAPAFAQEGSTRASTQTSSWGGYVEFYGLKAVERKISITT